MLTYPVKQMLYSGANFCRKNVAFFRIQVESQETFHCKVGNPSTIFPYLYRDIILNLHSKSEIRTLNHRIRMVHESIFTDPPISCSNMKRMTG